MNDTELKKIIRNEIKRQEEVIDLIASENYASQDILNVLGSPLTNKYSEGYPGKRYYPGNEFYDQIENLAKERALKTFFPEGGSDFSGKLSPAEWLVNVQPYSGSPANLAIYAALMNPGDTLMGMKLAAGGHLTHGHKVNLSGKIYNSIQYGINEKTGLIDYGEVARLTKQYKPKIIVSGLTAYPRKIDFKKIGKIAKSVGAFHVADISHIAGLVVVGLHQSPFPYCDVVMSTTHKTLRGPRGAVIFSRKELAKKIDKAIFPGMQGGPHNNVTAAKALMFFEALHPQFKNYQKQVVKNARALAENLKKAGFRLLTGGTDNHLMLADMRSVGLDGLTAEKLLEKNNITANRNSLPDDTSPFKPSGIRIGTPAATTRGMKEKEMRTIADLIFRCLVKKENVKIEVKKICKKFPLKYLSR